MIEKKLNKYKKIIMDLVQGIETWASDEDGIYNDCYDAYKCTKKELDNCYTTHSDYFIRRNLK